MSTRKNNYHEKATVVSKGWIGFDGMLMLDDEVLWRFAISMLLEFGSLSRGGSWKGSSWSGSVHRKLGVFEKWKALDVALDAEILQAAPVLRSFNVEVVKLWDVETSCEL
ncbi:hypothetical protein Droror1_Dr00002101 [Drosera rotundifolia]